MGTCQWEGWRGVGLPCTPVCNETSATIVARNTNHHFSDLSMKIYEDQTCNGGYQAYCCTRFEPSTKTNTGNLVLYGQGGLYKIYSELGLVIRGNGKGSSVGNLGCVALIALGLGLTTNPLTAILGVGSASLGAVCLGIGVLGAVIGWIAGLFGGTTQSPPGYGSPNLPPSSTVSPVKTYGQWAKLDWGNAKPGSGTTCDCEVT